MLRKVIVLITVFTLVMASALNVFAAGRSDWLEHNCSLITDVNDVCLSLNSFDPRGSAGSWLYISQDVVYNGTDIDYHTDTFNSFFENFLYYELMADDYVDYNQYPLSITVNFYLAPEYLDVSFVCSLSSLYLLFEPSFDNGGHPSGYFECFLSLTGVSFNFQDMDFDDIPLRSLDGDHLYVIPSFADCYGDTLSDDDLEAFWFSFEFVAYPDDIDFSKMGQNYDLFPLEEVVLSVSGAMSLYASDMTCDEMERTFDISSKSDDISGSLDDAANGLVTPKPDLDDIDTDVVPDDGLNSINSVLSVITSDPNFLGIMVMSATLMMVSYIFFGKRG